MHFASGGYFFIFQYLLRYCGACAPGKSHFCHSLDAALFMDWIRLNLVGKQLQNNYSKLFFQMQYRESNMSSFCILILICGDALCHPINLMAYRFRKKKNELLNKTENFVAIVNDWKFKELNLNFITLIWNFLDCISLTEILLILPL